MRDKETDAAMALVGYYWHPGAGAYAPGKPKRLSAAFLAANAVENKAARKAFEAPRGTAGVGLPRRERPGYAGTDKRLAMRGRTVTAQTASERLAWPAALPSVARVPGAR